MNYISIISELPVLALDDFSVSGGFTSSIFFASSASFGSVRIPFMSSNSEVDLITIPLFFVAEPVAALTGLISIATDSAVLVLKRGILSKKIPRILVVFLYQSLDSLRN